MKIEQIDLNLLVYLNVLLRERNVTRAAARLGITQPAMSNGLRRLRDLFGDPLLVRTTEGMSPTQRALELEPQVQRILIELESALQPNADFDYGASERVFRIMVSDYAEATLIPALLKRLREQAPGISLDLLTPSDVSLVDMEQGKVDMAINRFDELPQSFHQKILWRDGFSCLLSRQHPMSEAFTLDNYLRAQHIWVSKTGMGVGKGINPKQSRRLGWVDETLAKLGHKRHIRVFTRHYQMSALLTLNNDLIATLPHKAARMQAKQFDLLLLPAPFEIPEFELKMAWSPLLHHHPAHLWLRRLLAQVATELDGI